ERATVRKIAQQAGLTTGAIYHHYKNKDELLFDVITRSLQFTHHLTDATKNQERKTGEELLQEIIREVEKRFSKVEEQRLFLILLNDAIAQETAIRDKYAENYREIIANAYQLLGESLGIYNSEKGRAVASILIAALDGMAIQQSLDVLPEERDEMVETFVEFFLKSIPAYLNSNR
ncbi:MAG: TetR/AcrR family transcriptional regulator, partial [Clostridia bacterium]|nr:TetR/AcrR family transcriptional regulator [Clostridia bacterium]